MANTDESSATDSTSIHVSIIVPTFREGENIEPLVERICETMRNDGRTCEIVFVDDDSRDGSEEIVARLANANAPVRIIVRRNQRGLSTAVLRGFDEASGHTLLCMDADLSHPPEAIPALLDALNEPDVDFVIGSRYVPGASTAQDWGVLRQINSRVATLLARPFTRARDPMAGFFALRRSVYERAVELNPVGYKIGLELIVKCACRNVREVPIHFADRHRGDSKLTVGQQWLYVKHIARLMRFKLSNRGRR